MLRDVAEALDPVTWAASRLGVQPDDWQANLLRSTSDRILVVASRQSGKSTTVALKALHVALYEPGALVLIRSPSLQQSQQTFGKVIEQYRKVAADIDSDAESAQRLALSNGSRIVSLTGSERTTRGFSAPRLLIVDEASRVDDSVFHADLPTLVHGGSFIAVSTPAGKAGWFYDLWSADDPEWERYQVPFTSSRVPEREAQRQRRQMPEWHWRQEYLCEFLEDAAAVFNGDAVDRCFDASIEGWGILGSEWAA